MEKNMNMYSLCTNTYLPSILVIFQLSRGLNICESNDKSITP